MAFWPAFYYAVRMKEIFANCLPLSQILTAGPDLQYFGKDVCQQYKAAPSAILLPTTIEQVQACVLTANQHRIAIVPSGGRTGYSGGATAENGEVIISLSKMNKILALNPEDRTISVQAGVPLEAVQNYAKEQGLFYPVDFASRGSCLIGGTIATNAGGVRVIRHGLTRDWVLGLKVITGAGQLLDLNGHLFKNQTGYDLRQLFIGSEGTLGIVVEATLKLTAPPSTARLAFCAFRKAEDALPTLVKLRSAGLVVELFEFLEDGGMELVLEHNNLPRPFADKYPCYAVIEIDSGRQNATEIFEQTLSDLIEDDVLADVALSESSKQYQDLLALREWIGETANQHYTVHKNDISVPISDIPAFIKRLKELLKDDYDSSQVIVFGHLGDGNLHVNVLMDKGCEKAHFWQLCEELDHKIFSLVREFKGSISAEHGVGLLKKDFISYSRGSSEIALMRGIKQVFDPAGILNPGKIFDLEQKTGQ